MNKDRWIRPVREEDLDEVCRIEESAFSAPWKREDYAALIGRRNALFLAMGPGPAGENIAGYGCILQAADEGDLVSIAVREEQRGDGRGMDLLLALLREAEARGAERIFLEVRKSNTAAVRLYEHAGFTAVGIRKNYYTRPAEDALLMRWNREGQKDVYQGI